MIRNETRESAHLKSRVKDLSVVPNLVSFTGLFAAITPIAKLEKNPETGFYDPILIRDTDSLIANFGDPRIDPEKYIDLYSIMQVVGNGTSCYVTKVDSGEAGIYEFAFVPEENIINKDEAVINADVEKIINPDGHDVTEIPPTSEDETTKVFAKVNDLHNQYNAGKVFGYIGHHDAVPATLTPSGTDMTFTSRGAIDVSVQVTAGAEADTFNLLVNGEAVISNASSFSDIPEACPIASVAGNLSVMDAAVEFKGGSNEVNERQWEIAEELYSVIQSPTSLTITVESGTMPEKIIVKSASLDPEYGREEITLTASDGKHVSNALDRRYSIIELSDHTDSDGDNHDNDTEVKSDNCITEWSLKDGKNILTVTLKSPLAAGHSLYVAKAARRDKSIIAYSSMAEDLELSCTLSQAKPYSLKLFYLNVIAKSNGNTLGTAKVKLEPTTTNQALVNNINSSLGTYARFELVDRDTASAAEKNDKRDKSIVYNILQTYVPYARFELVDRDTASAAEKNDKRDKSIVYNILQTYVPYDDNPDPSKRKRADLKDGGYDNPLSLASPATLSKPEFKVTLQNYIDAQMQYKDRKYVGCLMADLAAPVTHLLDGGKMVDGKKVLPLDPEERRSLHYNLKQIACERKDSTVILSTPYVKSHEDSTPFTLDEICAWVSSQGDYVDLWEYGSGNTTDYSIQSFYLEIYYSWLNMQCTKIENGLAKSVKVKVPPSNVVINNILTSWRERGVQYPVAGDQYGTLSDMCTILQNPKTKLERDQLVQYRINPIWDTGTRGIQIYGNETLNAGYTDLNAAHIARTLVYIRSRVDEYTETLKFLINSQVLWDTWKNYVTTNILQPLQSANALSSYRVTMGNDTTSREEIANRMIKGNIELTFYQSAEIFDLSFIVYSSATTVEEANPL